MKKIILALLLGLVAFVGYRVLGPGDEAKIRKLFQQLASLSSIERPMSALELASRADQAAEHFTSQTEVALSLPTGFNHNVKGRSEIRASVAAMGTKLKPGSVEFVDLKIDLGSDRKTATAYSTVKVETSADGGWQEIIELRFELVKAEGRWQIERTETVETLER